MKLEAVGFGVFIPIFFVTSGLRFDLHALFASASTVARVPLFLLAIYLARGLPALVYLRLLGLLRSFGPRGGGRAGPWKLAGCVDLEPLARVLTGRRSPGSGSHRK